MPAGGASLMTATRCWAPTGLIRPHRGCRRRPHPACRATVILSVVPPAITCLVRTILAGRPHQCEQPRSDTSAPAGGVLHDPQSKGRRFESDLGLQNGRSEYARVTPPLALLASLIIT